LQSIAKAKPRNRRAASRTLNLASRHRRDLRAPAELIMDSEEKRKESKTEAVLKAFERVRSEAEELNRRQSERIDQARERDRQVLIERRRHPR
jgi:hypothetical protein